jgi:hypothetical protein
MPLTNQLVPRMSLAEIATHTEWQALTTKERMFLSSYLQSGIDTGAYDAQFAAQSAYNTSDKNAVILSYELLAKRKIRRVLDLHFGRTETDSLQADLVKAISKSLRKDPTAPLSETLRAAIKLYEKQSGVEILKPKVQKQSKARKPNGNR